MRKQFKICLLSILMAIVAIGSCSCSTIEDIASDVFKEAAGRYIMTNGDNNWQEEILLNNDGSFTYKGVWLKKDYDTDDYTGSYDICNFSGKFKMINRNGNYIYTMELDDSIGTNDHKESDDESKEGYTLSYENPFENGVKFELYLPGASYSSMSSDFMQWYKYLVNVNGTDRIMPSFHYGISTDGKGFTKTTETSRNHVICKYDSAKTIPEIFKDAIGRYSMGSDVSGRQEELILTGGGNFIYTGTWPQKFITDEDVAESHKIYRYFGRFKIVKRKDNYIYTMKLDNSVSTDKKEETYIKDGVKYTVCYENPFNNDAEFDLYFPGAFYSNLSANFMNYYKGATKVSDNDKTMPNGHYGIAWDGAGFIKTSDSGKKSTTIDDYDILKNAKVEEKIQDDGSKAIYLSTDHFVLKMPILEDGKTHWQYEYGSDEKNSFMIFCTDCKGNSGNEMGRLISISAYDQTDSMYEEMSDQFINWQFIGTSPNKTYIATFPTQTSCTPDTEECYSKLSKEIKESICTMLIID